MQNRKGFLMMSNLSSILNMFNMDPKSTAIKNAMAKRRYNTVVNWIASKKCQICWWK